MTEPAASASLWEMAETRDGSVHSRAIRGFAMSASAVSAAMRMESKRSQHDGCDQPTQDHDLQNQVPSFRCRPPSAEFLPQEYTPRANPATPLRATAGKPGQASTSKLH